MGKPLKFTHYQDQADEWRWRAQSGNGRIVAESGEGYQTERNVLRALDSFLAGVAVTG